MTKPKILIVDDEERIRFAVRDFLELQDYDVVEADTCVAAEEVCRDAHPDAAVLDYGLPDGNALELLPRLKTIDPDLPVVILTGQGTIDLAVRAIKEGADHFLMKPVELPALLVLLQRLIERERTHRRDLAGEARRGRAELNPFLGTSVAMRRLAEQAEKMAEADSPVLILGETGAGKGVLARWLHEHSSRAREAFVDLNCAGLSRELLESELFGYAPSTCGSSPRPPRTSRVCRRNRSSAATSTSASVPWCCACRRCASVARTRRSSPPICWSDWRPRAAAGPRSTPPP